jgi:ADP-heptose:LPS heptosyltransferase
MIPWHRLRTLVRQPRKVAGNYGLRFQQWVEGLRLNRELNALRVRLWFYRRLRRRRVIVLVRHGGIGDVICTFPAVLALRARNPHAYFVYAVWSEFRAIVEMGKVADAILALRPREYHVRLCVGDYDELYELKLAEEVPAGRGAVHLTEDFARTLGVQPPSLQPRLVPPVRVSREMRKQVDALRGSARRVIGLHGGPTWPVKEWPSAYWAELGARLRDELDCALVQIGSDVDTTRGRIGAARIPGAVDWVDRLDLPATCAAIAAMDLLIGVDSGLLHVAGAVGTPSVGLFGPTDPAKLLPPETTSVAVSSQVDCLGCQHRTPILHWQTGCPHDIACMKELKPSDVVAAVAKLVASSN